MHARAIAIVVTGLVLGTMAALVAFPEARHRLFPASDTVTTGKALVGGPFRLTDMSGRNVTDQDYRGRYMLVFFGYTSCPDICPAGLQLISAALEKIGAKAERVAPIFISVDPQRDTPQKLADYVKHFDPRVVGLTGTPEEIAAVAKAYKVYYRKVPNEDAPADYAMDHTSIIYVMDPNGEFVAHFTPTTTVDEMAAKLDKLL